MRKRIVVLLTLTIGLAYYPSDAMVIAAGNGDIAAETEEKNEIFTETEEGLEKLTEEGRKIYSEGETEKKSTEAEASDEKTEVHFLDKMIGKLFSEKEVSDGSNGKVKTVGKKEVVQEADGLKNLQIPQKLDVVIDPWEMDKKGQVYSEEYTISNTGDMTGILTLSGLTCRPKENSGVIVKTDKAGIHDSEDKYIYMEMLLGNGEQIIFSQESAQFQKELKPGENLSFRFIGEVNENAFGKWENNDVEVSVVYSWKIEESADAGVENQKDNISDDIEETKEKIRLDSEREMLEEAQDERNTEELEKADLDQKEAEKAFETDMEKGKSEWYQSDSDEMDKKPQIDGSVSQEPSVNETQEPSINEIASVEQEQLGISNEVNCLQTGNQEVSMQDFQISNNDLDFLEEEKNEIKNINLLEQQKRDVVIDSWKIDEKGQIVSPEYLLYNAGDTTGIWTISEIVCEPQEQSGVVIQRKKDELSNVEGKNVYMELVFGNGEKMGLFQDESQYKVELKPGEKLSVRFVGKIHGNLFEVRKEGDITVTAVSTWNLK